MNTVIYARYSAGPRQTDQSIEGQLRVCTDFCKQRGLTVIDTYCDRHISGRTDERPEFQRLIADAKRKKFEAVVVYKTDRFARNKYDSAVYKRELKRNGIQIFYAAEAIPDGPEGIILESLMEGLAEYYSAELAQKIKRGMHESALKCQSTGSGRPLGYRVDEQKRFQIDPESAQTVQTIFEQYIKGESNAAICELLNSRGLRTAQGKPFNKNSINRIIKNRKYIGEYRYHDIVVEGGMPAIISKDTFNLAQAEMERRRTRKAPKSPKAEYLLAGRLFCGHCKGPMQGVSGTGKSGNKWYYYYCGNTRGKNKTCDKKQVSRDRLERAVVDFTVRYILQEDVLEELARKVHAAQERQNDTTSEIAFYEKKLADNKKSIANVLRAIESGAATQTLPARLQELENEQAVILGEISFLKGKRLAFTEGQILFALMKHLEPYPGESEQDYRRRIISDFVSEVYLYDDRLLIYFNISSEDGKLKSADLSNIEGGEFDEGLVSSEFRPSDGKKAEKKESVTAVQNQETYAEDIEKRLTEIVSSIDGAGKTRVMVTLDSGAEQVYAKNEKIKSDTSGGTAIEKENFSNEKEYVLIETDGNEGGMIIKLIQPKIRGVAVVCEGGGSDAVRQEITQAITAVLDISASRVYITKMSA